MSREQPVRTRKRDRPDLVLDPVVVDRELPIVDVSRERSPSLEAVFQRPRQARSVAVLAWAVRALLRRIPSSDRWYVAIGWLILCSLGADWSGLHYMVGAFLAGAVLDAKWFGQAQVDQLRHHVLLVLMPVFFLSTGLRTQWDVGGYMVFFGAGMLLLASIVGKLLAAHLAGKALGWAKGEASIIGWLLQTKGLIEIIFANILLDKQIITNETFTALLLMAVFSTMLTVPIVYPRLRRSSELLARTS